MGFGGENEPGLKVLGSGAPLGLQEPRQRKALSGEPQGQGARPESFFLGTQCPSPWIDKTEEWRGGWHSWVPLPVVSLVSHVRVTACRMAGPRSPGDSGNWKAQEGDDGALPSPWVSRLGCSALTTCILLAPHPDAVGVPKVNSKSLMRGSVVQTVLFNNFLKQKNLLLN